MVKVCILAFVSGIFFFFLILHSAWWLIPGVLTWTAIFAWQDRQERTRASNQASGADVDPNKED
jgi:hypothetical protein